MPIRKQRATTSKTYAMDICYTKALADAKRIHRDDGKFYMDKINDSFTSISKAEYSRTPAYQEKDLEEWNFINGRWRKRLTDKISDLSEILSQQMAYLRGLWKRKFAVSSKIHIMEEKL